MKNPKQNFLLSIRNISLSSTVLLSLTACSGVVDPLNAVTPSKVTSGFQGQFSSTVDAQKINYDFVGKARQLIAETRKPGRTLLAEPFVGPLDHNEVASTDEAVHDPQLERYIRGLIEKLIVHWPGGRPDIRIVFTYSRSPTQPFNAKMSYDGTMFVSMGVLLTLQSTDELAFIIAHELSHLLLNHFALEESKKATDNAVGQVLMLTAAFEEFQKGGASGRAAQSGQLGSGTQTALEVTAAYAIVTNLLLSPAWGRQQEVEADLLAVDMMLKAGFSPRGVSNAMERFQDQRTKFEQARKEAQKKLYDEKLKQEQEAAKAQGKILLVPGNLIGEMLGDAIKGGIESLMSTHPDPKDRDIETNIYIKREYNQIRKTRREIDEVNYKKTMEAAATGPLLRNNNSGLALFLLGKEDFESAYAYALRALENNKDTAPGPRRTLYDVKKAQYQKSNDIRHLREAVVHLESAWKNPAASGDMAISLAADYGTMKRYSDAEKILLAAGKRFGTEVTYYPYRIANLLAAGRDDEARTIYRACIKSGDESAIASCRANVPEKKREGFEPPVEDLGKA